MHNSVEIVASWMIIGALLIITVGFGVFLQRMSRVNTFHAQVNPVIERYGGLSNQSALNRVSENMSENGHVRFYVSPVKPDNTNAVEGYGKPIHYRIHMAIPFFHSHSFSYTTDTTSKVGEESSK